MTTRRPLTLARLTRAERERILERLAQLREIDHLIREPGQARPADPPPPLSTPHGRNTPHDQ